MPTPADQRLLELLDKWLSSLDLHLKYSSLDDDTYWKMQPWVEHQRPSRWIIDLAKQKTLALRKEVQKRVDEQDAGFSDALELMTFLANLVGSQHIERFIPLADPQSERYVANAAAKMAPPRSDETREMPRAVAADQPTATQEMLKLDRPGTAATATREMPRFNLAASAAAKPPVTTAQVTRVERRKEETHEPEAEDADDTEESPPLNVRAAAKGGSKSAAHGKPAAKPGYRTSGRGAADAPPPVSSEMCETIIADAARLMQWGRKWYELAELISRMADRPPLPDVRRVLKDQKANIEKLAGR